MPRNMSFAMTIDQIKDRSKTVTRRVRWHDLQPGTILNAVEKNMGLKKGEKVKRICQIRILDVRRERLNEITIRDLDKEGFPDMSMEQFYKLFQKQGATPTDFVNRIEFEYIEGAD